MEVQIRRGWLRNGLTVFPFGFCLRTGDQGRGQGDRRDQAKSLMHLEHVRSLVELCLQFRIRLGLLRRKAQIFQRRLAWTPAKVTTAESPMPVRTGKEQSQAGQESRQAA